MSKDPIADIKISRITTIDEDSVEVVFKAKSNTGLCYRAKVTVFQDLYKLSLTEACKTLDLALAEVYEVVHQKAEQIRAKEPDANGKGETR